MPPSHRHAHESGAPVVVGPFHGEMNVTIAESYEKEFKAVPIRLLASTKVERRFPDPGGIRHLTEVSVTQDAVWQVVSPTVTATDRSTTAKFMPLTVTVVVLDGGALGCDTEVGVGGSYV